jgi:hypothetical protein
MEKPSMVCSKYNQNNRTKMETTNTFSQAGINQSIMNTTTTTSNKATGVMTYAVSNRQIHEIAPPSVATAVSAPDTTTTTTSARPEAVALAAMQEAATILMEADQKKRAASTTPKGSPSNKKQRPSRVPWETRLQQLTDYKKEHGDLLIPIRYKQNPSLGKFVHNTREQYKLFHKMTPVGYKKRCSLTQARIEQLQTLGFVFATERTKHQKEDWNARLKQLEEYVRKHSDAMVPHGYKEDPSFGEWVHRQRTSYTTHARSKNKKANPLLEERIDKLKAVGFNFTVHEDKWMDHYNQLKEYRKKQGVRSHAALMGVLARYFLTFPLLSLPF